MNAITFNLFNLLEEDDSSLIYMGEFDDHFTQILIEVNEAASQEDKKSTRNKVSYLIAECFQNIIRHSEPQEDEGSTHRSNPKMFGLRNLNGVYYMTTSNPVNNTKVPELKKMLESLVNVSPEELREIYLASLDSDGHNEAGGAGLGLIEMARKSKRSPVFSFEEVNHTFSNFFMQIEVIPKGSSAKGEHIPLSLSQKLYHQLADRKILLVRKGDFSHTQVVPLFKLIEANITKLKSGSDFNKKSIYLLIEILQNISKHGYEEYGKTEGIFTISEYGNFHQISSGNYVDTGQVAKIEERMSELAEMNLATLRRNYKKALFNFDHDSKKGGAGLGLIEMFKVSREPVQYSFEEVNKKLSFFSLTITI
ncbi:SiaB family protein kinase [Crocinitomix catalasitica]|nr:SiaB family protein kinase [Crocinitomix catalasitica]